MVQEWVSQIKPQRDPKKRQAAELNAMMECAAELNSKQLVARLKPHMVAPTLTQIGAYRQCGYLHEREETSAQVHRCTGAGVTLARVLRTLATLSQF